MVLLVSALLLALQPELVDVTKLEPRLRLDIRYATPDNFVGKKLYSTGRCLLRPAVAEAVVRAQRYLDAHRRGYTLLLKDCYRPASVQAIMWEAVKGTPKQKYVANPRSGSVHSYGAAVDATLADAEGHEVDMGTPYDHLGTEAEPRNEASLLAAGKLTPTQVEHRHMLRDAMVKGGSLKSIQSEWWHFDALRGAELRARYEQLDVPLEAVP